MPKAKRKLEKDDRPTQSEPVEPVPVFPPVFTNDEYNQIPSGEDLTFFPQEQDELDRQPADSERKRQFLVDHDRKPTRDSGS